MSVLSWIQSVWAEAEMEREEKLAEAEREEKLPELGNDELIIRLMNDGHSVEAIYDAIERYGAQGAAKMLDRHHRLNWS